MPAAVETPSARAARERRQAAERARRSRAARQERGVPDARVVDQALAEGLAWACARAGAFTSLSNDEAKAFRMCLGDVLRGALLALWKRDGYDKAACIEAVKDRVKSRPGFGNPNSPLWLSDADLGRGARPQA